VYPVPATGTRSPGIAYRQSAINNKLAPKPTHKPYPNPTLTLPLTLPNPKPNPSPNPNPELASSSKTWD